MGIPGKIEIFLQIKNILIFSVILRTVINIKNGSSDEITLSFSLYINQIRKNQEQF